MFKKLPYTGLAVALALTPSLISAEENKEEAVKRVILEAAAAMSSNSGDSSEALAEHVKSQLADIVETGLQNAMHRWNPNVEFSIEGLDNAKPSFGLLTVQPLYESGDLTHTAFVQGSVFHNDGRTTGNIGLGYRWMSPDQKWLAGVNSFYDHEWPYDHQRWSVGMDLRSSAFELNANRYMAISDWVSGRDGDERALDGYDVELGAQLPYMPGAKTYVKRFFWDGVEGAEDLEGFQYSLELNAPILPGLTLEAGVRDYDGAVTSAKFVKLTYKLALGGEQKSNAIPSFVSEEAYALTSMKDRRLDKVRRENKIVKQLAFTAAVSGF